MCAYANKLNYMKIQIEIDITQEMVESLVVGALEGGSNYWYWIDTDDFEADLPKENEPLAMRIAKAVYTNPSFKMPVYDIEDEEDLLGFFSQKSLKEGLIKAAKEYPDRFNSLVDGEEDAEDCDVIFQLCVMGEITFG